MSPMTIPEARKALRRIPAPDGLVRVAEAAAMTGHNPETLRRRIRLGQLRAWGFPRRVRLDDVLFMYLPDLAKTGGE